MIVTVNFRKGAIDQDPQGGFNLVEIPSTGGETARDIARRVSHGYMVAGALLSTRRGSDGSLVIVKRDAVFLNELTVVNDEGTGAPDIRAHDGVVVG